MAYRHHGIRHPRGEGLHFPDCGLFRRNAAILDNRHSTKRGAGK